MTSCSNYDESTEQTFFVNVYTKWEDSEEKVAKKAFLYIYENENKSIDNSQSTISVVNDGLITYTDGSKSSKPKYATKFQSGVFNIENMPKENTYYGLPIGKNMGGVPIHLTKQSA